LTISGVKALPRKKVNYDKKSFTAFEQLQQVTDQTMNKPNKVQSTFAAYCTGSQQNVNITSKNIKKCSIKLETKVTVITYNYSLDLKLLVKNHNI